MFNDFLNRLKDGFKDQNINGLAENFVSLSVLQIVNYLLPLVTLPYLIRTLGVEKYGLVMFAQAFILYFLMISDYGFNLSATREISIHRDNKDKISEIFFSVMIIKAILTFLCLIILSAIVFNFEKFRDDWQVFIFAFGTVAGNTLFPIWFFQGMEKMKYITILNITAKLIFTVLIFVFIRNQADYIYVPIFSSLGYIASGIISLYLVFKYFKPVVHVPEISIIYNYFKNSTQFFLSRVSVSLYSNSNMFVIGLILGNTMAGYYSVAEKLFIAMRMIYTPLVTALYPYMCKMKNLRFYKKIFIVVVFANLIICSLVFFLSGTIISILFDGGLEVSANLLKIFSIICIIIVPSILLGYPYLAAMGYPKYVNYSVIIGSIVHLTILMMAIPLLSVYIVAVITLLTETTVFIIRIFGVKKYKLWSLQ